MFSLILAILFALLSVSLGRWTLERTGFRFAGPVEAIAYGGGLGLGMFSYTVLTVGLLGGLYPAVILGLLGGIAVLCRRALCVTVTELTHGLQALVRWRPTRSQGLIAILLVAFLLLDLLGALAPPTEADALVYHLAVPKVYVRAHQVIDVPYNLYSYLPFGVEMLYTAGLVLDSSGIVAALTHYTYGVLIVLAIYSLGRRYFSPEIGLWAALFFVSPPMVTNLMSVPAAELGPTLYFTLALAAVLRWCDKRQWHWAVLAGIFAGLTAGAKLQPVFLVMSLGVVFLATALLIEPTRTLTRRQYLQPLLGFAVLALLVASPWFIKNWVYTGNPIYPFLYSVFGGKYWSAALAAQFKSHIEAKGVGYDLFTFLATPWFVLAEAGLVNVGFASFAFVPFALRLRGVRRRLLLVVLALATVYYPLWFFFIYQRHKHLLYLLPAFSLLAAVGLHVLLRADWLQRWARLSVLTITGAGLLFLLGGAMIYQSKYIPVALGLEERQAFLDRYGLIQKPYRYVNTHLPPDSRVMLVGVWDFFYYLDVDYLNANPLSQGYIDYATIHSEDELLARLQAEEVTHLLLRTWGAMGPPDRGALPRALPQRAEALYYRLAYDCGKEIASFPYTMPASRTLGTVENRSVMRIFELRYPSSPGRGQPSARSTPTVPRQPR